MLFVSDLHLSAARPDIVGLFLRFLGARHGRGITWAICSNTGSATTRGHSTAIPCAASAPTGDAGLRDARQPRRSRRHRLPDTARPNDRSRPGSTAHAHGDSRVLTTSHQAADRSSQRRVAPGFSGAEPRRATGHRAHLPTKRKRRRKNARSWTSIRTLRAGVLQSVTHDPYTHRPGDHARSTARRRRRVLGAWYNGQRAVHP